MKKILALLLALLLLALPLVSCSDDGEEEGENNTITPVAGTEDYYKPDANKNDQFAYERINGDEAQIVGFSGDVTPHAVSIPAEIRIKSEESEEDIVLPVVKIAKEAFRSKTNITAITVPAGITEIDDYAFEGCTALATVVLPDTLVKIGELAFAQSGITTITVPATVTERGLAAFYGCEALRTAVLPNGITALPNQLFMGCKVLDNVTWSNALVSIGAHAFHGCSALANVTFPQTLTSVGDYAFANCSTALTARPGAGVTLGKNVFYPVEYEED